MEKNNFLNKIPSHADGGPHLPCLRHLKEVAQPRHEKRIYKYLITLLSQLQITFCGDLF